MELKIVFTGDSVTLGEHIHPDKCWVSLIENALKEDFTDHQIICINHGVNGATTRIGLENFPGHVQAYHPQVVVIQYGFNDCNCWDTDEGLPRVSEMAFRYNLAEMVNRSRHFGAEPILVNNHPTLRHKMLKNNKTYEYMSDRYGEMIDEVAMVEEVKLFDINHKFASVHPLDKLLLPEPDLLHPNELGHQIYAYLFYDMLVETIEEIIKRG